jgi:two-component system chemotaxis response regulator CheY
MMPTPIHFLVVDDQPITRLIMIAQLSGLGYTCITEAEDGWQALNILRAEKPPDMAVNFVITDWNMPVMDGLTLLQTLRASDALRQIQRPIVKTLPYRQVRMGICINSSFMPVHLRSRSTGFC